MSSTLPIRPAALEDIQSQIQELTELVEQLQTNRRPTVYQYPDRIPKAMVKPEKFTSTLPLVVMLAPRRYAEHRGGENINVIISEALRAYIPREHFVPSLRSFGWSSAGSGRSQPARTSGEDKSTR